MGCWWLVFPDENSLTALSYVAAPLTSEAGAASYAHARGKGKYSLPVIHYTPVKPTRENPCRLMTFSHCFGRSLFWPSPVQSLRFNPMTLYTRFPSNLPALPLPVGNMQ